MSQIASSESELSFATGLPGQALRLASQWLQLPAHILPKAVEAASVTEPRITWIDGTVRGDLFDDVLIVGPQASVTGTIIAQEVVVLGQFTGEIIADRISLRSGSQCHADLYFEHIGIELGARFEGNCRFGRHTYLRWPKTPLCPGAGGENRTLDLPLTKGLRYHYATPATGGVSADFVREAEPIAQGSRKEKGNDKAIPWPPGAAGRGASGKSQTAQGARSRAGYRHRKSGQAVRLHIRTTPE